MRHRLRSLIVDPSSGHLPGIQGVRGLAAASILLFHAWGLSSYDHGRLHHYLYPQLPLGVTMLFVLSSFLLYRPFVAAVLRARPCPSFRRYLVNRALRIIPAYWFILVCAGALLESAQVRNASHQLVAGEIENPLHLLRDAFFLQNLYPGTLLTGIGPAWALTDIVVFYLVLPLLVLMAAAVAHRTLTQRGRRLAALSPAALLLAIGVSGKSLAGFLVRGGPWTASWHAVIERSAWGHADFFALGMVVAVFRVESEDGRLRLPKWWWQLGLVAIAAIGITAIAFTTPEGFADGTVSQFEYDTLMAVACSIGLSLVVLPGSQRAAIVRVLEWPALVAVGVISYSLFLWQVPVLQWMRIHGLVSARGGPVETVGRAALILTVPFLLSVLTYRFIELPVLRHKTRSVGPSTTTTPAARNIASAP